MTTIAISDLTTSGYTLFVDSESFMNDLSDSEIVIRGGTWSIRTISINCFDSIYCPRGEDLPPLFRSPIKNA
jgi:hypothetical protein